MLYNIHRGKMIFKIIKETIMEMLPMILLFIVTFSLIRVFELKKSNRRIYIYDEVISLLFILYIIVLFTFLSKTEINVFHGFNIIPFEEISRYKWGSKLFVYNVVGNVVAFIPFGLYFAYKIKPSKIYPVILSALSISALVEFIQYYIGRSFDIDDVILNVLGATIGYILFKILRWIHSKLPRMFHKEGLYNLVLILILVALIVYIFVSMGVINLNEFL